MNYFLYIVSKSAVYDEVEKVHIQKGEWGVGKCSLSPGISDEKHGIMYIAPKDWVEKEALKNNKSPIALSSDDIATFIMSYFLAN